MKSLIYFIAKSKLMNKLASLFYIFTSSNIKKSKNKARHPFIIVLTVDTEPGYIKKNLTRKWISNENEDLQGYYKGINNLLSISRKHEVKFTFLLNTKYLSSENSESKKINKLLRLAYSKGHEIGLHLHPRRDTALQKALNKELKYTSARFYSQKDIKKMLIKSRELIKNNLGNNIEKNMVSFRWGNWAIHSNAVGPLIEVGFRFETSVVPGLSGHKKDNRIYDWKNFKTHHPCFIDNKKSLLEIPIATFKFLNFKFRADPFLNSSLLINCFKYYYKNADRSTKPFIFVVMTHSSEATTKDGKITYVIDNLRKFINFVSKNKNVCFKTLKEAAALY